MVPPAAAQPEVAPDRFPINAIDITGITKLDTAEVEQIIYKYTGPDKSNVDVEAARKAIQDLYTAKGYEAVLVESPVQPRESFEAGIITIAVNEAPVRKIEVVGSKYHSAAVLRRQLSSIREGEPLNFKALQGQFEAVTRFPDRRVDFNPVPNPGDGTIDVELKVKDKLPVHGSLELNDDNSPFTKRLRLIGAVRYTDLFGLGHTFGANFIMAPQRTSDSLVFAGNYTAPILGSPWTLSLSGYRSNSNIAALGGTSVLGNGYQIGLRAAYRLPTKSTVQTISFGPDFKNFSQNTLLNGAKVGETPIRYVPFTLSYSVAGADTQSKLAKKIGESTFDVSVGGTFGIRALRRQVCYDVSNGSTVLAPDADCRSGLANHFFGDQFGNSGLFSKENFVHVNVTLNWALATKSDWLFSTSMQAQFADSHLISNEQFGAGGRDTVRGYYQSEEVGDEGIVSNLELASPSLASLLGPSVDELRAFAFVDTAWIHTIGVSAGVKENAHLLSVGGGARTKLFGHLSGEVIVGVPLKSAATTKKGDPRTVFVVRGEF